MGRGEDDTEACGRCAMSSVSGVMEADHDPFEGDRIEVEAEDLRRISPGVLLGRVKRRIDGLVAGLTYDR